ncbi:MAG: V-type ATP synthase subunit I [Prochlorococcaceae cyanobacterium]|jgi:V/A-type H+-transporting ATPase subunit I
MSIVPLVRVTLLGLTADRSSLLEGLQQLGCLHLIPTREAPEEELPAPSPLADRARRAVRYLQDVPQRRHPVKVAADFDLERIVEEALANQQQRREAQDELLRLRQHLEELAPWGDFLLPELDDLGGQRLWFYRVPHAKQNAFRSGLEHLALPWQQVYASHRHAYVVLISPEEPIPNLLPVPRAHLGSQSARTLEQQLDRAQVAFDDLEAEHQALSRWVFLLSRHLARADDQSTLQQASSRTHDDGTLVQVEGWAPRPLLPRLESFAAERQVAITARSVERGDTPPTLMRNPAPLATGQDLVTFYETPGYNDWDPSIAVFLSFAVFFAMILADAGYALVLGVFLAISWRGMGRRSGSRHFRTLSLVGLVLAFLYGVLAGSYFGVEPPAGSLLERLKLLNLNDFDYMMKFSIVVGCVHIFLANLVVAMRAVSLAQRARPLGWIVILLGGLSLYLGAGRPLWVHLGFGGLAGGALTILLLSSERPLRSPASFFLRLVDGVMSLASLSQLFGDVMSYLRLFALGLASASLAITFNQLASEVGRSEVPLAVPIALLILLLGHGTNILLGIISGFVHGLRLNFIEFFNWTLSEEGYPFQPFNRRQVAP